MGVTRLGRRNTAEQLLRARMISMQIAIEYLDEDLYSLTLRGTESRLLVQLQGVKSYCELQRSEIHGQLGQRHDRAERKRLNGIARRIESRYQLLSEATEILESYESKMIDPGLRVSFGGGILGLVRIVKRANANDQMS